jgi:tetratricopeptide (TPR) repeat protein
MKLLQMISAMTPKDSTALITAKVQNSSVEAADPVEQKAAPIDFATPAIEWDRVTYEFASLRAIGQNDEIVLKRIDEAYRQTPDATMNGNTVSWEAHLEWARLRSGNEGSMDRLRALAASNPTSAKVKQYLARAFAIFGEHTSSAEAYISASALTGTDVEYKSRLLRSAAEQYLKDSAFKEARKVADKIRTITQHDGGELVFLKTMSAIARDEADDRLQVAVLERILELTPDDTKGRFLLALKQSELGNDDLALRNYLKIPETDRAAGTWNNIGVQYDKYKMSGRAVDAFSKAADLGETLAMSNLGNKLLGEGFVDQAMTQCERAIAIADRHQNVGDLMSRIAQVPELEQKLLEEILSKSRTKNDFYRSVGRAISNQDATSFCLSNRWKGSDCTMSAVKIDNGIRLEGTFERVADLGGLLNVIGSSSPYAGGGPSVALPKRKHEIRYTGHFEGYAFFGKIERKAEGDTLLSSASLDNKVIMVLSPDRSRLSVMESPGSTSPEFYELDVARE